MDVDQVREAELAAEAVRTAEGLGGEHRQVLDVLRLARAEQRLQQRVAQDAVVEELLEAVEGLVTAGVLEEAGHDPIESHALLDQEAVADAVLPRTVTIVSPPTRALVDEPDALEHPARPCR